MCLAFLWVWRQRIDFVVNKLRVNPKTVVDWFSFCREICSEFVNGRRKIGAPGKVVEVNGSCFGKVKYRGKPVKNTWVFSGVVQVSAGRDCFTKVVDSNFVESH